MVYDKNKKSYFLFQNLDLSDVGDIRKLRVCAGREDDDNPVWMVEQVRWSLCVHITKCLFMSISVLLLECP